MKRIIFPAILLFCSVMAFGQQQNIPDAIRVPDNSNLVMHGYATGVQIYICKPDPADTSRFTWVLKEPRAVLYADSSHSIAIGRHYFDPEGNPTWEHTDGSRVSGAKVAQSASTDITAIPWLLLKAIATQGNGVFSKVAFVQRVWTTGGKAPAMATKADKGKLLDVPYEAAYLFYTR